MNETHGGMRCGWRIDRFEEVLFGRRKRRGNVQGGQTVTGRGILGP